MTGLFSYSYIANNASIFSKIPSWVYVVIVLIAIAVFLIKTLMKQSRKNSISEIDKKNTDNTFQTKNFRIRLDALLRRTNDPALIKELEKLNEISKYSAPVSKNRMTETEMKISDTLYELEKAVDIGDISGAVRLCGDCAVLLKTREAGH